MNELDVDVVVAGGGVGGLMAAYRARLAGARVLLLGGSGGASNRISSLNTALGQDPEDTPARLFDDMFRAGGYVNDPGVVAALTHRIGPETMHLDRLGVPFHRLGDQLGRRQAAGSSWTRAVYSDGMIGVDIARRVLTELQGQAASHFVHVKGGVLTELITREGRIAFVLAYSPRDEQWFAVRAPAVVLATGGAGQLFGSTTNPRGSKGTGYAAALELGAELVDMEFVSFEPFVTSGPGELANQDLPTTVLREGARLLNGLGEEFLDTRSAPSKDIICRAMVQEVAAGRGTQNGAVVYDLTDVDPVTANRYVQLREAYRSRGITSGDAVLLEVMPAQHFLMGGVKIDARGAATVPGLFAAGEAAGGAHGAHRLAANGGLEVVAGGAIAGEAAASYAQANPLPAGLTTALSPRPDLLWSSTSEVEAVALKRIQAALDSGCGILRTGEALKDCVATLSEVHEESLQASGSSLVRRAAAIALAIAAPALARTECRGDHYRTDHGQRDDRAWLANQIIAQDEGGQLEITVEPVGHASCPALAD